jgi:hypothetical protein
MLVTILVFRLAIFKPLAHVKKTVGPVACRVSQAYAITVFMSFNIQGHRGPV